MAATHPPHGVCDALDGDYPLGGGVTIIIPLRLNLHTQHAIRHHRTTHTAPHNAVMLTNKAILLYPILLLSYSTLILFHSYPILLLSYSTLILFYSYPILLLSYSTRILFYSYPILLLSYSTLILFYSYPILLVSHSTLILFYCILFYSILFYSILFYPILLYPILLVSHSTLCYPMLSYAILCYPMLSYAILFLDITLNYDRLTSIKLTMI